MGARRVRIIRASLGQLYYEAGRWDDAVAELGLVTPGAEPDRVDHLASAVLALILARRNHWDEARIRLDHVPDVPQGSTPPWAGTRSLLLARALRAERWGRTGEAVAALRPCLDASLPDELPGRHRLLATLVRLALAAGDTGTAVAAANAAARDAAFGRTALGAIVAAHCRGLLAGDPESVLAAAGDFEAAGQPLEQAQALADAAVLAAVRHELPSARQALAVATAVYDSLEAQWDAQCIAARLRQYGVRQYGVRHGRVGRQRRSATGWGALTPAELKIAYLIAAGRSNPDIAAELYLSRNTVQTHVSHILAKLGARSRTEIVGVAADNPQAAST
jgi:DNA-binding CsgD family transcriptional regulator